MILTMKATKMKYFKTQKRQEDPEKARRTQQQRRTPEDIKSDPIGGQY